MFPPQISPFTATPVTILIVDDNESMRQTIRKVVAAEGDTIVECSDGKEAFDCYTKHRPDWVLMDISMKGITGIEATANITQADPHARVLIVTDHGDRFFRTAAKRAGAQGFVLKENLQDINSIIRTEP